MMIPFGPIHYIAIAFLILIHVAYYKGWWSKEDPFMDRMFWLVDGFCIATMLWYVVIGTLAYHLVEVATHLDLMYEIFG